MTRSAKTLISALCFTSLTLLSPLAAQADQINLRNGDRISGTIEEFHEKSFVLIKTDYSSRIYVDWAHIKSYQYGDIDCADVDNKPPSNMAAATIEDTGTQSRMTYSAYGTAPAKDLPPVAEHDVQTIAAHQSAAASAYAASEEEALATGAPTLAADGSVYKTRPEEEITPAAPITEQAAAAEEEMTEEKWFGLLSPDIKQSGEINAGGQLKRGNSEKDTLNLDAKWTLRRPKDRMIIYGEYNRSEEAGEVTEDDQQLRFTYDYFLSEKWFLEGDLKFEKDDVAELDLRTIFGVGLGYQFYERDDLNLQVLGGVNYQNEEFANGSGVDSLGLHWGLKYDQKIWKDLKVYHEHDLTTPFEDLGAFLFESKTGLKMPLIANIIGSAEVEYDHNAEPAPGAKKDDTIYRFKIGYSW